MKKFYAQIFIAAFLLIGFCSQAQLYTSINPNPSNFTFDDPRYWVGEVRPPNPCTGCVINVNSTTWMPNSKPLTLVPSTAQPTATNVFTVQTPPGTAHLDAPGALTVGMRFQASVPGQITGVRFWQDALMSGSHTVALYADGGGAALATATLSDASGFPARWRTISFGAPVTITPGTTYVVATFMANGYYVFSTGDFAAPIVNGVLTGLQHNPPTDPNAVYDYSAGLVFPTSFYTPGTNYWVDPVFAATPYNLDDVVFNGGIIGVRGNTNLNINTKVELTGTALSMGNDPTSTQTLFVNDQLFLDPTASIQLANGNIVANANNSGGNPIVGTFSFGAFTVAGIFTVRSASPGPLGATDITLSGPTNGRWDGGFSVDPYTLNCTVTCNAGLVFGPASTQYEPPINDFYGFGLSATLPVVLAQFIATKADNGSVKLSWTTSQEVNAGYYDVERSGDQTGWTKIGSVKAKGNSTIATDYSLYDNLPLDGTGYYRLKMVDLDGKYVYSKTVSVTADKNTVPLVIYNNPFTDMIRLKVNVGRAQNLTMTVSDMLGKTYLRQSVQAQAGDNLVNLQPAVIGGSGIYILRITGDSYNQTAKIEKQ
jgi:hypothetical protein